MKKIVALLTMEKWLKKEWENDDSDYFRALCISSVKSSKYLNKFTSIKKWS